MVGYKCQIKKRPRGDGNLPEPGPTGGNPVDTPKSSAPDAHPTTEECFACYEGVVYIGHLVEDESGEEVEVVEAVPCRRCSDKS
jgi:hypothetical protein